MTLAVRAGGAGQNPTCAIACEGGGKTEALKLYRSAEGEVRRSGQANSRILAGPWVEGKAAYRMTHCAGVPGRITGTGEGV